MINGTQELQPLMEKSNSRVSKASKRTIITLHIKSNMVILRFCTDLTAVLLVFVICDPIIDDINNISFLESVSRKVSATVVSRQFQVNRKK